MPVDVLVPRWTLRDSPELLRGRRDGPGGGLQGDFFCKELQQNPELTHSHAASSTMPIAMPGGVSSCAARKEQK